MRQRAAEAYYRVLHWMAPDLARAQDDDDTRRRRTILNFWLVGALPWPLVFCVVYGVALGCPIGSAICAGGFVAFLLIPGLLRLPSGTRLAANWMVAVMLATLTALGCITGGSGSPALTWLLTVPLVAIHVTGLRPAVAWCGLALVSLASFDVLHVLDVRVPQLLTTAQIDILASAGNIGVILLIATLAATYDAQRQSAMRLADERQLRLRAALDQAEEHAVKLAESAEALRVSEERLRLALEATSDAIWDWDLLTNDAYYSPRWFTMLGYPPGALPCTFESWRALTHPDDVPAVVQRVQQAIATVGAYEAEFRMRAKDGTWRWVLARGRVSNCDAGGRAIRMLGTNADITDRKRAEEDLRREKGFSEAVFESLPGVAYVFDEQGKYVRWNRCYSRELGWSDEDMARINVLETVSPADRERVSRVIQSVFENGYDSTELEVLARDGRTKPHFCTGVRVELDGKRFVVGAGTEMSELRRATEALRESEALYRSLVQNSPMGMHFYELREDETLVFTAANPAADLLTGIDSRALVELPIEQAFPALRGTELPDRYRAAARDGVAWTSEQIRYDDGRIAGVFELRAFQTAPGKMVAVFMNITDRVQAETAVREREREIALQAGKAEVATDVLHNVGNVLSRVKVSTTLLAERLRKSEVPTIGLVANTFAEHEPDLGRFLTDDERGRAMPRFLGRLAEVLAAEQEAMAAELRSLTEAIEHIALIVSMQQIHNQGHGLVEAVRPADVIEQALNISISAQRRQSIEVVREIEAPDELPLHRHKVLQILVNLLNNAKHAVLSSATGAPRVTVSATRVVRPDFDGVRFSVTDNGVGISAEHLDRIFSFGFTTRQDGHGFGLHSAANLAQEMGGVMRVASAGPGRGATFTLELPLASERAHT